MKYLWDTLLIYRLKQKQSVWWHLLRSVFMKDFQKLTAINGRAEAIYFWLLGRSIGKLTTGIVSLNYFKRLTKQTWTRTRIISFNKNTGQLLDTIRKSAKITVLWCDVEVWCLSNWHYSFSSTVHSAIFSWHTKAHQRKTHPYTKWNHNAKEAIQIIVNDNIFVPVFLPRLQWKMSGNHPVDLHLSSNFLPFKMFSRTENLKMIKTVRIWDRAMVA